MRGRVFPGISLVLGAFVALVAALVACRDFADRDLGALFPPTAPGLPPSHFLFEELFFELVQHPSAVGRQPGVFEKGIDQRRVADQPRLVDDQGFLRSAGDGAGELRQRRVRRIAMLHDANEDSGVVARLATMSSSASVTSRAARKPATVS